jgi:hypothetical protein
MSTWLEVGNGESGGNLAGHWPLVFNPLLFVAQDTDYLIGVSGREFNNIFAPRCDKLADFLGRGPQPGPVGGPTGAVTGWAGLIKVDGTSYTWMGAPKVFAKFPPNVEQTGFEYTSERSTFIMNVGNKISMNVTFISPITPTDLKRQSIIGSYLQVTVASMDGAAHEVQLYADTSAGMCRQILFSSLFSGEGFLESTK